MSAERAVFFDPDGTLLHYTRDFEDVLADAVAAVDETALDQVLGDYGEAFFERFEALEPEPSRGAFAEVCDADPDALAESLRREELEMCLPHEDAAPDLERLAREFRIGVLTNGVPEWQRHKLEAYDLDEHVDAFVASYEVGAHKPDAAPFREAENRLPADGYAMVGDDDADVEGARAAGWTAYRYDGEGFCDLPDVLDW